jgi:uncharacterized protein YjbJ (UPF0337 family)
VGRFLYALHCDANSRPQSFVYFYISATNDFSFNFYKSELRQRLLRLLPSNKRKEEFLMDREHVKGTAEKVEGTIKDTAGKVTDDKKLQTEGKVDKAKGSAHKVAGDVKDAVKQSSK